MNLGRILGLLFLLTACSGNLPAPGSSSDSPSPAEKQRRKEAYRLYEAGRNEEAIVAFQKGAAENKAAFNDCAVAWYLTNLAAIYFRQYNYRKALATYQEEKPSALRCGDRTSLGILYANIASLYTATGTGDINAASENAERGLTLLDKPADAPHRASVLITRARIDAHRSHTDSSIAGFRQAIELASQYADPANQRLWQKSLLDQSTAWKELGEVLILNRRYAEAEDALANSFRVQVLNHHSPTAVTYRLLAELRRVQGDLPAARRLIERALEQASAQGPRVPMWRLFYERGRILLAQNEPLAALRDFETAIGYIRRYRIEFLPADSFRISNENYLQDVYMAYVHTCNQLPGERNRDRCTLQTFEASEENRAVSIRTVLGQPADASMLTDDYQAKLNQLEAAERSLLRNRTPELVDRVRQLQAQLTEDDLKTGMRLPWLQPALPGRVLAACRDHLRPDEALLAFSVGEPESYLWTVTRHDVKLVHLPARSRLERLTQPFREAAQSSSPAAPALSERLYRELFGQVDASVAAKSRWILVLDQELFHLPYAALVTGYRGGQPVYLVESHALQQVPAAGVLAARPCRRTEGAFVALGDAVYNRADRRWNRTSPAASPSKWIFTAQAGADNERFEMPRLPGTGPEIQACARAWDGAAAAPAVLLSGMDAGLPQLFNALKQPVSILHIAAHFVPARGPVPESRVALSIDSAGRPQLLSEREIYSRRLPLGLVVLSGCASGDGTALPASGLLGMTRAWLAAGAHSVAASLWPTSDDTGEIFVQFYRALHSLRNSGVVDPEPVALQQAQLALLASRSWRAQPSQWAAYFLVTKD